MIQLVRIACGRDYSAWALNNYATKLFVDEQYGAANEAFTQVIKLNDKSAHYWAHRGASRYSLGDYKNAISDLTAALNLENSHQIGLTYRGYALMTIGDYPAALAAVSYTHLTLPTTPYV